MVKSHSYTLMMFVKPTFSVWNKLQFMADSCVHLPSCPLQKLPITTIFTILICNKNMGNIIIRWSFTSCLLNTITLNSCVKFSKIVGNWMKWPKGTSKWIPRSWLSEVSYISMMVIWYLKMLSIAAKTNLLVNCFNEIGRMWPFHNNLIYVYKNSYIFNIFICIENIPLCITQ